jgi:hypothetical protein
LGVFFFGVRESGREWYETFEDAHQNLMSLLNQYPSIFLNGKGHNEYRAINLPIAERQFLKDCEAGLLARITDVSRQNFKWQIGLESSGCEKDKTASVILSDDYEVLEVLGNVSVENVLEKDYGIERVRPRFEVLESEGPNRIIQVKSDEAGELFEVQTRCLQIRYGSKTVPVFTFYELLQGLFLWDWDDRPNGEHDNPFNASNLIDRVLKKCFLHLRGEQLVGFYAECGVKKSGSDRYDTFEDAIQTLLSFLKQYRFILKEKTHNEYQTIDLLKYIDESFIKENGSDNLAARITEVNRQNLTWRIELESTRLGELRTASVILSDDYEVVEVLGED